MVDKNTENLINEYNGSFDNFTAVELLNFVLKEHKGNIAFATSLGAEDQALTEMIASIDSNTRIFTLDTGRMFPESYDLIDITMKRYKVGIEVLFPETKAVQEMVRKKGINLFYESIENRKLCCHIRKIEPLKRALADVDFWISGLRREQSITRQDVKCIEWDELNGKVKINPLIEWTEEELWEYIHAKNIPYNKLHDKGFPSIGCQPCTRAVEPGEDVRAGRWWWEDPTYKECGLHKR